MTRQTSVGIIGTGWVGASVAISTLQAGLAHTLLLSDVRSDVADGEAMDLAHGSSFYPAAHVASASVEAMLHTDAIVIAAGKGGRPGQSRIELLRDNAVVIDDLARRLRGYAGIVIMVTNPVDVLTYSFAAASGLPKNRIIGTGTMLDTARLRQILGQALGIDPRSVHAQVVGEHGESEVVLWSGACVGGRPLRDWSGWTREREVPITRAVRNAAQEIIRRKGATNHAIGLVTASLLQCLLRDERRILTVSRVQEDALGFGEVAFSLPSVVGAQGAEQVLAPLMDADERQHLERSASVLREAIALSTSAAR